MKARTLNEQTQKPRRGGSRSGRKIVRLPLDSLGGLIKEAGCIYRQMKANKLDHDKGKSLVWVLAGSPAAGADERAARGVGPTCRSCYGAAGMGREHRSLN